MDNCIHIRFHKLVDTYQISDDSPDCHELDYFNIFIIDDSVTNRKLFYGIDNEGLTYQFKDDEDTLRVIDELVSDEYQPGSTTQYVSETGWVPRKSRKSVSEMMTNIYRVRHGKYMESLVDSKVNFRWNTQPWVRGPHYRQQWIIDRLSPLYEQFKNVRPDDNVQELIDSKVYRGSKYCSNYWYLNHKPTLSVMNVLRRKLVSLFNGDKDHTRELIQRECEDTLNRKNWYQSTTFKQLSPVR